MMGRTQTYMAQVYRKTGGGHEPTLHVLIVHARTIDEALESFRRRCEQDGEGLTVLDIQGTTHRWRDGQAARMTMEPIPTGVEQPTREGPSREGRQGRE